jgi:hypothetical protein
MHYGFSPQPVEINGVSATQWSPDGDKAALKACQVRLVDRPYHVVIFPQTAPILYQRGAGCYQNELPHIWHAFLLPSSNRYLLTCPIKMGEVSRITPQRVA